MKKLLVLFILFWGIQINVNAQLYNPPGIQWQKSYWPYEDECYNFDDVYFNSASETNEDWFYKSCVSYNGSTFDGFVCAGYSSSYRIRENDTCRESSNDSTRNVGWRAKVAKIDPNGKELWYNDYGELFSELYSIIQGSDGYYYAVGRSHDFGSSIIYNKGANQKYITGKFLLEEPRRSMRHVYVIKLNTNGDLIWQYIYGPYDDAVYARKTRGMAYDIVESSPLKFKVVGFSQEFNGTNTQNDFDTTSIGPDHPFVIEIDTSGTLQWKSHYTSIKGRAFCIDKKEYTSMGNTVREFVIAGKIQNTTDSIRYDGMVFKINNSSNPTVQNLTRVISDSTKSSVAYDVLFRPNGDIILPLVFNCDGTAEGGEATGRIIHYNNNLSKISEFSIGTIKANDLKIGICNTSDNGFILTTTKQLLPPANSNEEFWNSDAYVAKYNSSYVLEWDKVIPNNIPVELNDADLENEECVYSVLEHPDGGYLITGNISPNYDDDYLIKLYDDCGVKYNYTVTDEFHQIDINTNTTWNSSKSVLGLVTVKTGQKLTITGSSTVIEFADSKKTGIKTGILIEPGARLDLLDGAKLTALNSCSGSMWDGIVVMGNSVAVQSALNQGYLYVRGDATIEYARVAVFMGEKGEEEYSFTKKSGGIIDAENANFVDNYQSIVIKPYVYGLTPQYNSIVSHCDFINNGIMRDPSYVDNNDRPLGHKDFISLSSVNKFKINNNTFVSNTSLPVDLRGIGINSFNSHLQADSNTFSDLTYGIYNSAILSIKGASTIYANEFTNVRKGIFEVTTAFQRISSNNFNIPGYSFDIENPTSPSLKNETWGIKMENSHSFNISENTYSSEDAETLNSAWGSIVSNSTGFASIIEKDNYQSIAFGTQTEERNPYLSIKCNTYNNHFMAWSINPQSSGGVLQDQGEGVNSIQKQAGDLFDNVCAISNQEINSTIGFKYYAAQDAPLECVSSNVSVTTSSNLNITTCGEQLFACNTSFDACSGYWEEEIYTEENETKKQLMVSHYIRTLIDNDLEDDALDYLEKNDTYFADENSFKRLLITSYYSKKDFGNSNSMLSNYDVLDSNDQDFVNLMDILLNADSLAVDIFYLVDDEIEELKTIAANNTEAAFMAKSILRELRGINFDDAPELWEYESESRPFFNNQVNSKLEENISNLDHKNLNVDIKLYPNPASSYITIEAPKGLIEICDILGKKLSSYNKGSNNIVINSEPFDNGVYLIRFISDNKETKVIKFIINK
jgi:hypothetical protein